MLQLEENESSNMLQPEEKGEVQHAATRMTPSAKSGNVKLSALRCFFVATSRHLCYQVTTLFPPPGYSPKFA
uniref:Uncharacterized protein n=1 Tax=Ascaris lumbricoides TaxID=6252 RepID=A0A0M3I1R4_ASCLU